ncbi:MAG: RNA polymerase sigma factor [candidate division Zixibacteria bacterium]|nr:RNA polymerase sigma factor [candidate division Zixibacteria bacterium]
MTEKSDEQLVKDAQEGNKQAFKELIMRLEPRVATTVIGMLGDCPEADDVGQETFVRFYRALKSFRGESSVVTYVTRIAINLSLNELKRRKRKFSFFSREDSDNIHNAPDMKNSEKSFENKELVQWALQKLSADYKVVLVLRLMEGYSTEETAKLLKIPIGTVTSRLFRAQNKMKELLAPDMGVSNG